MEAALGWQVVIPTLNGDASLDIPAGTQSGEIFSLAGAGLPDLKSRKRGALLVEVALKTPTNLSSHQEELLKAFLTSDIREQSSE